MDIKIIIRIPEKLKTFLDNTANDLYDDFKGKYASKEEFWITLREINNVNSFELKQIKQAIQTTAGKCDPFILYCSELMLTNPKRKSSLVYTLRGLTNKLYNLHQNLENALFTRQIKRDDNMQSPVIEIAQKVAYRQLPYIKTPEIPIEVGSLVLMEKKQNFFNTEYKLIEEYPLFGGHLYITKIDADTVTCKNSLGRIVCFDILEMPAEVKEKDVIFKSGIQYTVDKNETQVRAIQEQIQREKQKNILLNKE